MSSLAALLADPQAHGVFVSADAACTPEALGAYAKVPPANLSWARGFLGLPPLDLDLGLAVEPFVKAFADRLTNWMRSHPPGSVRPAEARLGVGPPPAGDSRIARIVRFETRFVSLCLEALGRWNRESDAVVLWDIDETLLGSGVQARFLRPSSDAVLRYAERHFPGLRHGILSSLAPNWIPPAAEFITRVLAPPALAPSFDPRARFSFRPALDRFEKVEWEEIRTGLRAAGLPDCGPGNQDRGWPFYVTEFSRILTIWALRARGWNVKVVDNDLNACFDEENAAENRVSGEVQGWMRSVLGSSCALGPHWWPQEAEEWILELIGRG